MGESGGLTRAQVWKRWLLECSLTDAFDSTTGKPNMVFNTLSDATQALNGVVKWFSEALQADEVSEVNDAAATYVQAHVGSQSDESIVKALATSFSEETLKLTKNKLKNAGIKVDMTRRRTVDKDAEDIVKAVHEMEKHGTVEKTRFLVTTENVKFIPKYTPEEMSNCPDLLRRVAVIEAKLNSLGDSHAQLQVQVSQNTDNCKDISQKSSVNSSNKIAPHPTRLSQRESKSITRQFPTRLNSVVHPSVSTSNRYESLKTSTPASPSPSQGKNGTPK